MCQRRLTRGHLSSNKCIWARDHECAQCLPARDMYVNGHAHDPWMCAALVISCPCNGGIDMILMDDDGWGRWRDERVHECTWANHRIIVRALAGSLWARAGERGTVIGEEGSRKGRCGGGEAPEAVEAHGALPRYHFHIFHYIRLALLSLSLPNFSLFLPLSLSSLCFPLRDPTPHRLFPYSAPSRRWSECKENRVKKRKGRYTA